MSPARALISCSAVLTLGFAAGCGEAKIAAYRAPKDAPPVAAPASALPADHPPIASAPSAAASPMAATAVPTAGGSDLKWTVPASWQTGAANAMRKATYIIAGDGGAKAELTITAFPGDVGGEMANLTRWRGQVGLPDAPATEIAKAVTRFKSAGLKFAVADFANDKSSPPARLIGAIVPVGDSTWFFKFTGPPALLEKERVAFLEFLKTIKAP